MVPASVECFDREFPFALTHPMTRNVKISMDRTVGKTTVVFVLTPDWRLASPMGDSESFPRALSLFGNPPCSSMAWLKEGEKRSEELSGHRRRTVAEVEDVAPVARGEDLEPTNPSR